MPAKCCEIQTVAPASTNWHNMKSLILFTLAVAVATTSAFDVRRSAEVQQRNIFVPEIEAEGRITNGATAVPGQFPYQAGLVCTIGMSKFLCGGSVISETFVLTAAHCAQGSTDIIIYLGATKFSDAPVHHTIHADQVHVHPKYNPRTISHDIALLEMPFTPFSAAIKAVKLPALSTSYSTYAGDEAISSGWGLTSDNGPVSKTLQFAPLNIINNSVCKKDFGVLITANKLCTANVGGVSTCQGDSGGPLVLAASKVQVGVVSFGSNKGCEIGISAVYTRVTSYRNWIEEITGI